MEQEKAVDKAKMESGTGKEFESISKMGTRLNDRTGGS